MGDFNLSPKMSKYNELKKMSNDNELKLLDVEQLPGSTKTFTSKGMGSSSWIDHCLIRDTLSGDVSLPYEITPSDHIPMVLELDWEPEVAQVHTKQFNAKINWKKLTAMQKLLYLEEVQIRLDIVGCNLCELNGCDNMEHCDRIEAYAVKLIETLKS